MVKHVITLANSIVGVSVLAMPFCFKVCGIFLASFMLVSGAMLTRIVCHFLLKAGTSTKRRTYEMLAYHTFGQGGKLVVEITIICFLGGTLVAFLVVVGDLGPPIIAEMINIENNDSLRTVVMAGLVLFVALPLALLRDIDSLGSVSTASFLIYIFLVIKILNAGLEFVGSDGMNSLNYWRPVGALQCIPIFSMALSCQTQIFSIYDSLPEPSLHKMNDVVKKAVYLCSAFYFSVGLFGYIAFSTTGGITGNILMSFGPSWTTQFIKLCFVLSIVFSVPLSIFPCRASLYSLMYRGTHSHHSIHEISTNYIPDGKLRLLTVLILGTSLITAILIPNIELVLGLVGSTAGSTICIIFPSAMFIRVTSKNTTERVLAQIVCGVGICIMVLTTYVALYAVEQAQSGPAEPKFLDPLVLKSEVLLDGAKKVDEHTPEMRLTLDEVIQPKLPPVKDIFIDQPNTKADKDQQPILPAVSFQNKPSSISLQDDKKTEKTSPPPPPASPVEPIESKRESQRHETPQLPQKKDDVAPPPVKPEDSFKVKKEVSVEKPLEQPVFRSPAVNQLDRSKDFPEEFLKKLEQHQEEQKKLIEEQKEILAELKQHHEQDIKRDNHPEEKKLLNDIDKIIHVEAKIQENLAKEAKVQERLNPHKAEDSLSSQKQGNTQSSAKHAESEGERGKQKNPDLIPSITLGKEAEQVKRFIKDDLAKVPAASDLVLDHPASDHSSSHNPVDTKNKVAELAGEENLKQKSDRDRDMR